MFIYVVFNSAFSAKYHARNLHFKVWYVRINTLNKGDLACPVQPGATCATTNIEHKISRNGVGKMFLSTWCSYWLFHSLLPMFLDSAETCLEMKYEALSCWGRRRSEAGLSMGPGCLSFREGLAAVVQLNLYTCVIVTILQPNEGNYLGHTFSCIRTARESSLDPKDNSLPVMEALSPGRVFIILPCTLSAGLKSQG